MIVNPDKFQAILLDKTKSDHTNQRIVVDNENTKAISPVESLGVQIDDKLNFNLYISNICRSAANQLNALIRVNQFLGFKEKKILKDSYFMVNFKYCPLVWMFLSALLLKKRKPLKEGSKVFLYRDYEISYEELLQNQTEQQLM